MNRTHEFTPVPSYDHEVAGDRDMARIVGAIGRLVTEGSTENQNTAMLTSAKILDPISRESIAKAYFSQDEDGHPTGVEVVTLKNGKTQKIFGAERNSDGWKFTRQDWSSQEAPENITPKQAKFSMLHAISASDRHQHL